MSAPPAAASKHVDSLVTLASSAPVQSTRGGRELAVTVSFDPDSCRFVASLEGAETRRVFSGPSLILACSAANEALEALAPLETLIGGGEGASYRRTRPQYLQEARFCDALKRLRELAGVA